MARKRWIAFSSKPKGVIVVDDGARDALRKKDRSLLASGIAAVEGNLPSRRLRHDHVIRMPGSSARG